jgi:plastocyanin
VRVENILPIIKTIYQLQQELYRQVQLQQQLQLQQEQIRQTLQLVSMVQFAGGSFVPMIEIGKNASSLSNNTYSMAGVLVQIQSQLHQLNFQQAQQAQLQQSLQFQQAQLQQSLQFQQAQLQQLKNTIDAMITNRTTSASVEQGQEKAIAPQVNSNTSNRTLNAITAQNQSSSAIVEDQSGGVATTMTESRFDDSNTPIVSRTGISPLIEKKASAFITSPSSYEDKKNSTTVDISATTVLQNRSMSLGPSVKNFFILIPNEAHHGPNEEEENRLIDQPFIPSAATISKGTAVTWLNCNVDHEHVLSLTEGKNPSVNLMSEDEDEIDYGDSTTYVFNTTGDFTYTDTNTYDEGFKMTGRINVVDPGFVASDSISDTIDTVGAFIVPAEDLHEIASKLKDIGLNAYSVRHYTDPTYNETQALIIWTSFGQDFKETVPELRELIYDLPYS